jgi:beta-galactosidase/beta-glucuronidase
MKVDIEPIVEQAVDIDAIALDMRNEPFFYIVRLANGDDYTVKWTRKEIQEFQPSKTVSQMIKEWEESILRRYEEAKTALETNLHPTRTEQVLDFLKRPTGETRPKVLDRYEKAHFNRVMGDMKKQFGSMVFVKIKAQPKTLKPYDYVIYDKANDHVLQFETDGSVIIYGSKDEALEDCRGNESVVSCTDLPQHWQEKILTQINLED